ncbi:flagellar basal body rod protein FlgF [Novosphingobium sp. PS1R-30]|uniref:Flagellar basal-body rod protein FlgF n=1 Tax=Novosphingobium anseongense TaxID=3133436 RepID=A0ABU8RWQ1_9SPHN|nr:MAG: flagellar hook-basal body complex protein [Novosphingobium sp.]
MDRLIYTAATGMTAAMTRQRVVASNLANAQTIGFRAEMLQSTPMTLDGPQLEVRALNSTAVRGANMQAGSIVETGNPLDIALQGDAMLGVQTPDGGEGYTRRGDLSVSQTGVLQNGEGLPILGQSGAPITVPLGNKVTITPDGDVMVQDPATPDAPAAAVDKLKLAAFRGSQMEKDLTGIFRAPNGGILPVDETAKVIPASLEQSNVKPTEVLVEMVEAQRSFDMRTKLIATAKELDEGGASLMRITPG